MTICSWLHFKELLTPINAGVERLSKLRNVRGRDIRSADGRTAASLHIMTGSDIFPVRLQMKNLPPRIFSKINPLFGVSGGLEMFLRTSWPFPSAWVCFDFLRCQILCCLHKCRRNNTPLRNTFRITILNILYPTRLPRGG